MGWMRSFFAGKTVLVTGATGFLGKALVEKVLRALPEIRRLYLLVRGKRFPDDRFLSAEERVWQELFRSPIFATLRRRLGEDFEAFVRGKVQVIEGDLAFERLGLDTETYDRVASETDVFINGAALVSFDERLDKALQLNALGVVRALGLAKRGKALRALRGKPPPLFAHISTCYVCGIREGLIFETPPDPTGVEEEVAELLQLCQDLEAQSGDEEIPPPLRDRSFRESIVEEGMRRAKERGFNDTYTYTKWLGERLLVKESGDVPAVILRPSIVESTLQEPEPGWIENMRMADPLIIGFARRYLKDFPGDPDSVVDLIPCDFVVNATLAIVALVGKGAIEGKNFPLVFQVATSTENLLTLKEVIRWCTEYFERHPLFDRDGRPMRVKPWTLPPLDKYLRGLRRKKEWVRHLEKLTHPIPFLRGWSRQFALAQNALERLEYYVNIYAPYTHFKARFVTENTRKLWEAMDEDDRSLFPFDVRTIDWRHYLQQVHIPGLKRHILRIAEEGGIGEGIETLPDLLAYVASRFPDKVALQRKRSDGGWVRYTYADFYRLANGNARRLAGLGVRRGDRVVLWGDNCPEWVIAYFSASFAGATVVPLDRQWHPDEVASLARFVDAKAALVGDNGKEALNEALQDANLSLPVLTFSELVGKSPTVRETKPLALESPPCPDDIASILFVTGPVAEPRGAMLTHRNLLSDLRAIVKVLPPRQNDQFLSLLPLHHALSFTGELLIAMWAGATVTYPENLRSRTVLETMVEVGITALIGVPRVFQILHESILREVKKRGRLVWLSFRALMWLCKMVRQTTGHNLGRSLFASIHRRFGGKLRALVSGGAALPPHIFDDFYALGFVLCEGYGLTEAAPVVAVNPMDRPKRGSVGKPLPGVEVVIAHPDERGIGEILVRGPNVFVGYFRNPGATQRVLREGWLYTGDLGRFDKDGYLYITGRVKDVIVTAAGKNVYPEEVERKLTGIPGVKELCVVGVWDEETMGERVHLVVVPEPQWASSPERLREFEHRLRREVQGRAQALPSYQRIAQVHILTEELPKTVALAPDRAQVRALLQEQKVVKRTVLTPRPKALPHIEPIKALLAYLTHQPKDRIHAMTPLDELGVDSLLRVELTASLEAHFRISLPEAAVAQARTVGELAELLAERLGGAAPKGPLPEDGRATLITRLLTQEAMREAGAWVGEKRFRRWVRRKVRDWLARLFTDWFAFEAFGTEQVPHQGPFIIAANHASHLDTAAILVALGDRAEKLFVLGARDYFFNTPLRSWFFHTFLRVIPFDRTTNPFEGLRLAAAILRMGHPLLIFPEGTRSVTGKLQPFKPGIGLLSVELNIPVIPALIEGTFEALPKGRVIPRRSKIRVTFGEPIQAEAFRSLNLERHRLYQRVADEIRARIEGMRRGREKTP